ncbi:MAG: PIN domain-containing protein [Caldilinea sp.]
MLWRGGVFSLQITLFFVLQVTPAHLLDTGILIRRLRNRTGYHDLVQRLNQTGDLCISAFTRVEVLRGMREHERERTVALLDGFITQVQKFTILPHAKPRSREGEDGFLRVLRGFA